MSLWRWLGDVYVCGTVISLAGQKQQLSPWNLHLHASIPPPPPPPPGPQHHNNLNSTHRSRTTDNSPQAQTRTPVPSASRCRSLSRSENKIFYISEDCERFVRVLTVRGTSLSPPSLDDLILSARTHLITWQSRDGLCLSASSPWRHGGEVTVLGVILTMVACLFNKEWMILMSC